MKKESLGMFFWERRDRLEEVLMRLPRMLGKREPESQVFCKIVKSVSRLQRGGFFVRKKVG